MKNFWRENKWIGRKSASINNKWANRYFKYRNRGTLTHQSALPSKKPIVPLSELLNEIHCILIAKRLQNFGRSKLEFEKIWHSGFEGTFYQITMCAQSKQLHFSALKLWSQHPMKYSFSMGWYQSNPVCKIIIFSPTWTICISNESYSQSK